MKIISKIVAILALLAIPYYSLANFSVPLLATSTTQGSVFPAPINGNYQGIQVNYVNSTSTSATSTYGYGINLTKGGCVAVNTVCLSSGGGTVTSVTGTYPVYSSGGATPNISFDWSTTTNLTSGRLIFASGKNTFNQVSTSSETCTAPVSCTSFNVVGSGGAVSLNNLTVSNGGTGATTFGQGWINSSGGTTALSASTSPTVNYITSTSTTAVNYFQGTVMIGNALYNGGLNLSGLGTTNTQFQVSNSINDLATVAFGNTSLGTTAADCLILDNGATVNAGFNSTYFGGLCYSGPNWSFYPGLPPNSVALTASDGAIIFAALSTNSASSSMAWAVGPGYTTANYDMVLVDASSTVFSGATNVANLGLSTTTPMARFTIVSSSTNPFPYFLVASSTNSTASVVGSIAEQPFFIVSNNGDTGLHIFSPSAILQVSQIFGETTANMFVVSSSTSASKLGATQQNFFSVSNAGVTTVTGSSSNAFAVTSQNPIASGNALQVDTNAILSSGSGVSGIDIIGNNSGTSPAIKTISSGASNEGLTIATLGTGSLLLQVNNSNKINITANTQAFTVSARSSGSAISYSFAMNSDTSLTAATDIQDFQIDDSHTMQHNVGNIALERHVLINAPTDTMKTLGQGVITTDSTLTLSGPPIMGLNASSTNSTALLIQAGTALNASTTNAYSLILNAPTGATNNYAASSTGRIVHTNLTAFATGDSAVCIRTTGELTFDSGVSSCIVSSKKYKHNIEPLDESTAMTNIMSLPVSTYEYNSNNQAAIGIVAEDAAKIDRRYGSYDSSGVIQSTNYEEITSTLVKVVQEQQKEINSLKDRLNKLEK